MDRFEAEITKILESAIDRTQPPAKKHTVLMTISITMTVVALLSTTWLATTTAENQQLKAQLKGELQNANYLQQDEYLKPVKPITAPYKVVDPLADCDFIIVLDGIMSCDKSSSLNYL